MKLRFVLLLALIVFMLMAWSFIKYEFESQAKAKLEELSALPIHVYFVDSTMVSIVTEAIQKEPAILSIEHEKGIDAARKTVADFDLPVADAQLEDFQIPDILTIRLKADYKSVKARSAIVSAIKKYINESDVDDQHLAWDKAVKELNTTSTTALHLDIMFAILTLIIFILGRLHGELKFLLNKRLGTISMVDQLVYKHHLTPHALSLLLGPSAAIALGYYLLKTMDVITVSLPYYFFILQIAVLVTGTVTTIWIINNYFQQAILQEDDYGILKPKEDVADESERS
ncbi:MAG: hypothetical protein CVU48_02545 [Candidatus Cloacimonetes bacterium HGW-Cloacimonetes-1]|jgi:hypothetical protein|nr:MAG: hypothetical protein CVU48_02545 [Candidatus Cloacimonetes bacterium HGW-Cloacimonetes-1]